MKYINNLFPSPVIRSRIKAEFYNTSKIIFRG